MGHFPGETRVHFGEPQLEGYLWKPEEASASGTLVGCILTHPHPKLGGHMNNNVVLGFARRLQSAGSFCTLRFNTRGVGGSGGRSGWSGKSERKDIIAAINYLRTLKEVAKVVLIGYSFGAAVGLSVSETVGDKVDAYVAVSYPRGFWTSFLFKSHYSRADSKKPKLFVIGDKDDFTGVGTLTSFVESLSEPKQIEIAPGVDHFWFNSESALCDVVQAWLEKIPNLLPHS